MKILIPVAGFGKRLRPHTHTTPKSLIKLAGKTVLGHILTNLKGIRGVSELILIVSEKGEEILEEAKKHVDYPVNYVVQEEKLGLGHAVYQARDKVEPKEKLLIILGDTIVEAPIAEALEEGDDFIGVKEVDDPRRFGVVKLDDNGRVEDAEEKPDEPKSNLAIVGLYYFNEPQKLMNSIGEIIRKKIKTKGEYQLTDALKLMLKRGWRPKILRIQGWYDCGKVDALLDTHRILLEKNPRMRKFKDSLVIPPVHIEDEVIVENSIIGPYVTISRGAKIKNSILKDTIVSDESELLNVHLERSLIGRRTYLKGEATKVNLGDDSTVVL